MRENPEGPTRLPPGRWGLLATSTPTIGPSIPASVPADDFWVPNLTARLNRESARLAAVIWTVTATAQMAGLNLLTWLTAYLDECGYHSGKPPAGPDLERFLPWHARPEDLSTWAQPSQQPG
ncbi:MAG: hypothetical protein JO115_05395 [Pseudonocardiales bacterium]|nr:hypothetical protein [Pseudonocardiales bacterium]